MAEDTSKVVIIALVTLIILAGGFLLFQKFTSKSANKNQIKNVEQNQVIQDGVLKEIKSTKEDTSSVKVLPKTGGEIYFVSLVALSFIASGWGLSKFPK